MKCWRTLLLLVLLSVGFGFANAAVSIDTVITAESTCQANGQISVTAGGNNTPFLYSITAGPVTRPPQSSPVFNALPAGTYTVQVQNQVAESATATVVVTGNYQLITMHPIPVIYCTGASQGYIIGNVVSGGKPPFTYQLVAHSPITTAPQSSDTFYNLPDGSYTLRVTDDCGNFQTTGVVLSSVPSSLTAISYTNYLGCNNTGTVQLNISYTNLQLPINVALTDDQGNVSTMTINSFGGYSNGGYYYVIPDYNTIQIIVPVQHMVFGGSTWSAVITNACGVSLTMDGYTASVLPPFPVGIVEGACPPRLAYSYGCTNNEGMYTLLGPDSLKFFLYDVTTGMYVDTFQSNNTNYIATKGIIGHTYRIYMTNSCGVSFTTLDWVWDVPAPPVVYPYPVGLECLDSTTAMEFVTTGFNTAGPLTYIIHSGPASMHSTKPGYEYAYSLSYPDTLILPAGNLMRISNLPPGTYSFSIIDTCGLRIDTTFTITDQTIDAKNYSFKSVITGQCGIFNAIDLYITRGLLYAYPVPVPHFTYTITNINTGQIIETDNVTDSVSKTIYNVPTGTYVLHIDYFEFPVQLFYLNNNHFCTTINDTIVVTGSPYPHINGFTNSFCQSVVATELHIDSTGGVPPYTYEIISGPVVMPPQSSNVFVLPVIGTYTFRMVDACGNSYVSSTSIDTLIFPPVNISTTPCPGSNVLLTPVVSQFYSYQWQLPNGTFYYGDTLHLPNVSAADTGMYIITRYADISGCKDTVQSSIHLEMLARVAQSAVACYGDTIKVGNIKHFTTGTFIDTLTAAAGCDSIVTTHLTIIPAKYDTISATVCQGQAILIGPHQHFVADTSVHLIQDTITASTGCDSIVTVHLTVKTQSLRYDTIRICQGDTAFIPIEIHSTSGTIIDTQAVTTPGTFLASLFTAVNGCDSATFKRVFVLPSYFQLRFDTICRGDTVFVGTHSYTKTGTGLDTLTTISGCDSIILLILTVRNADTTYSNRTICSGQSVNGHTTTGVYVDTLQTASGCDSIVMLNLQVGLYASDSTALQLCYGQSIQFGAHSYNQTGIYRDTIATPGCDSISILNLTVLPRLYDSTTITICAGQTITIGAHIYNQTGIYRDTFSTATCDSFVVLNLTVRTMPHDTIIRSICSSQSITVGAHTYNQSGTYTDTLPTAQCDSVVTLLLTVSSFQTDSTAYYICPGNSLAVNGIIYTAEGDYRDTVPALPCDSQHIIHIQFYPSPVIQATATPATVNAGEVVRLEVLTSGTGLSYYWVGANPLNNPAIQSPVSNATSSGWYTVTATDTSTSCSVIDSVFVEVEDAGCSKRNLFVPNVFTPTGDSNNDNFRIFFTCPFQKFNIKIFNRWGEKVFESNDPYFVWNGTYQDSLQTPAVFVYYLEGSFADEKPITNKGSITLIR